MHTPLLHCAFGPHGDGLHGSVGASETETSDSMYSSRSITYILTLQGNRRKEKKMLNDYLDSY